MSDFERDRIDPGLAADIAWKQTEILDPSAIFGFTRTPLGAYFNDLVQRLLEDNIEHVQTATHDTFSLACLHLLPPNKNLGYRVDYHVAYEAVRYGRIPVRGLVVANPRIQVPRYGVYDRSMTQRLYAVNDEASVYRSDYVAGSRRIFSPTITGIMTEPGNLQEPENDLLMQELKSDVLRVKTGIPIKPLTNLSAATIMKVLETVHFANNE